MDQYTKTVTLGRKQYPVPELAIEHMRVLVPTIMGLSNVDPTSSEYFNSMVDVVAAGVTAGTPELTREKFEAEIKPSIRELQEAYGVVASQAGMKSAEEDAAVGADPLAVKSDQAHLITIES